MRIYLTGATGFVGTNLTATLSASDYPITNLDRNDLNVPETIRFQAGSSIIHLAGKAHDLKKSSNPDEYDQVNFVLTKKLFDAFLASSSSTFIFISSVKAVADSVQGILTEEAEPAAKSHYGLSKYKAEQYLLSKSLPDGKRIFILRPCMIHGPGNKGNLNLLYQFVRKGIPYPLAGFHNRRSFLSIDNLCFVIKELLSNYTVASGIYNIADDEALSTNDVVRLLYLSVGKKPLLWCVSPMLIKFMARVGGALHLPLNVERLDKLTESFVVSNQKIKAAIKKPLPMSAQKGLEITSASFQEL
jgi:nucleoside-diphosphate-sugar epimerase